jgi:PucR C-terminal helix-turn-helix domain/GAF domain/GGDEF-like domain
MTTYPTEAVGRTSKPFRPGSGSQPSRSAVKSRRSHRPQVTPHAIGVPAERLPQLLRLYEVTRLLASELDLGEISHRILVSAIEMIPAAQAGTLYLFDEATGKLEVQDSVGLGPTIRKLSLEPGECAAGRAFFAQKGEIYNGPGEVIKALDNASEDNREAFTEATQGLRSPKAAMSVPLVFKGDVLGALVVDKLRDGDEQFSQHDLVLLEDFGQVAAIGIINARLFDLERSTRLRLQVMNEELNRQRDLLDKRIRAMDAMAQVAREGFKLDMIASRLATLACGSALILDSLGRVRAAAPPGAQAAEASEAPGVADLLARVSRDRQRHVTECGQDRFIASPITSEHEVLGCVLLEQQADAEADGLAETLVDSAALIASTVFVREQAQEEGDFRRRADLLERLLNGDAPRTAAQFHELRPPFRLAVGAIGLVRDTGWPTSAQHSGLLRELRSVTAEIIQVHGRASTVAIRGDHVVVAWSMAGGDNGYDWPTGFGEITARMDRHAGWQARFALTPPIDDPQAVPQAYREAKLALEIRPWTGEHVIDVGTLGAYRMIIGAVSSADAMQLSRRSLGAVLEHDAKRGGNLLATLRTFLATSMSVSATAKELHVHVHTVQYRLSKIEELTGLSLRNSEERLTLELSLRINDLANALSAGGLEGPAERAHPVRAGQGRHDVEEPVVGLAGIVADPPGHSGARAHPRGCRCG